MTDLEALRAAVETTSVKEILAKLENNVKFANEGSADINWEELDLLDIEMLIRIIKDLEAASTDGDGWKMAPVEPTREMSIAAREKTGMGCNIADEVYRVMLAKAPLSPAHASKGSDFASFKDEVEQFRRECIQMGHIEGAFILRLCDAALPASKGPTEAPPECWSGCDDPDCPYTHT